MPRVVAHAFVADLARPVLDARDAHHLSRVLRLRPGEIVSVSDGRGGSRLCRWTGGADLEPFDGTATGSGSGSGVDPGFGPGSGIVRDARPSPPLTIAFALTKGEHPEWAVQKLTETGVDRVVVLATERCVVRWAPSSQNRQLERLREIARLAAMQSRRSWLPGVEGVMDFGDLVAGGVGNGVGVGGSGGGAGGGGVGGVAGGIGGDGGSRSGGVAPAVPGGAPLTLATPTVLVGPEGGWSDAEMAAVPHHVSLGPHVLRAETAALAAGLLLVALRAGSGIAGERSLQRYRGRVLRPHGANGLAARAPQPAAQPPRAVGGQGARRCDGPRRLGSGRQPSSGSWPALRRARRWRSRSQLWSISVCRSTSVFSCSALSPSPCG